MIKAKIKWLVSKDRIPPVLSLKDRTISLSYCPIIIFKNQYKVDNPIKNNKEIVLWSSSIFNDFISKNETLSTIAYMMENAPFELMKIGAEFELFEGTNKVACGIIIEKN